MYRLLLAVSLLCSAVVSAQTVDLLAPPNQWETNLDRPTSKMALAAPTPEVPLATVIIPNGGDEDYPKLRLSFKTPQDWGRYTRLRLKVRVTSEDESARSRRLAIVFYDDQKRHAELADNPMWQQSVEHSVPLGRWVEYTDWLTAIQRGSILQVDIYLYEQPAAGNVPLKWEFAVAQLEGVGDQAIAFDSQIYSKKLWPIEKAAPAALSLSTTDRLSLGLTKSGGVCLDGRAAGGLSGLLVRDVQRDDPPVMVGGNVTKRGKDLAQSAKLEKLGLGVEAVYRNAGPYVEISGVVRDLRREDRAVTVYFALPVPEGQWQWWDSVAASRTEAGPEGELACLEGSMGYGLNRQHSKYPIGAISLSGKGGYSLGIRMDEPVVHRIGYNPALRIFYLALDFGLTQGKTIHGKSLSEAPFRFLVYRHDPAWGFRSALQRYYDFFPEFFTNRIKEQGGWYVWGDMRDMPQALQAGFRMHWGPQDKGVKWDNENGATALLYIEAEFYQQTMGDYQTLPPFRVALERLRKVAAGDPEELAKYEKLSYAHSYVPAWWVKRHSPREAMQVVSRATLNSVNYEVDGTPSGGGGKYPWMGESQLGFIFPCSLDPDIPEGKGWFARQVFIESGLKGMLESGAHYDGIALDSFGGYGQYSRVNYRRENFQYVNGPLTFSATDKQPVIAMFTSSVEFARELAKDMHGQGKVLMANCSWGSTPGWLTFAAPYLDVLGAEAPQFADPDFARAIARHKLCTDLPYKPVRDWQLQRNQLHGIFPGHGNTPETMARFAQTFRDLATAGWEPITHARVAPEALRLERYGQYLVVHNPSEAPVQAKVTVDQKALGLRRVEALRVPTGEPVPAEGQVLNLEVSAQGTVVLKLQ